MEGVGMSVDSPPGNAPSSMSTLATWLSGLRAAVADFAHRRIWLIFLVLFILLALFVIRPFPTVDEPTDVATAWNEGIARLGILPLYPPAEDFYVGDVWAVIADAGSPNSDKQVSKPGPIGKSTLIGKSVRIAYIDLRKQMQAAKISQPLFPDTGDYKPGEKFHAQTLIELDTPPQSDKIALSLSAFPGVTINHKISGAASGGWSFAAIGIGGEEQQSEQIRIPVAETYGAPIGAAFISLDEWCLDPNTAIFCTDEYVRRVMAYSVSDTVLATANGQYTTRIKMQFIYRVFMTREIKQTTTVTGARQASLKLNANQAATPAAGVDDKTTPGGSQLRPGSEVVDPANTVRPAAGSTIAVDNSKEIGIDEVFQRPLVFGYRAITVDLTPSKPGS